MRHIEIHSINNRFITASDNMKAEYIGEKDGRVKPWLIFYPKAKLMSF